MNMSFLNAPASKILASVVLILAYLYFDLGIFGYILILGIMAFATYAYLNEYKLIRQGNERFHGDNLFFRYGKEIVYAVFPIPVHPEWDQTQSIHFANELMARIQNYFIKVYGETPLNGQQTVTVINVTDSDKPSDTRSFIKISFKGSRGAMFSRFITYQAVGKYIVIHRAAYLLGIAHWYDKLFFIVSSPITVLFWIYSWLKNEYSVYAVIARGIGNSFEALDMKAFYESSAELITDATMDALVENGLYTEKLGVQVNNFNGTFNQYGNSNSVLSQIK